MNQKLIRLSQRHVTALRTQLRLGARADWQSALKLGHQAVALGVETLELARIHERALVTLDLANSKHGRITQRLVARSAKSISRFARKLNVHQPA